MEFDFETRVDRSGTGSLKWEKYAGRDVLPMWVADMDFVSPPAVVDALRRRVEHGVYGYTLPPEELYEVIISMLDREYGWRIEKDWIVWLPGLVTGLNVCCRAVCRPGDSVITGTPVYPPFLSAPANFDCGLEKVGLVEDGGRYGYDPGAFEEKISEKTRLFFLCSPHNPVGRAFERSELEKLAEICVRNEIVVCSDEIHCGLVLDREHIPFASLDPEVAKRTITLMAPSKTFNIPGLGCSFAIVPDSGLRKRFRGAMEGIVPFINAFGYTAALAAYRDSSRWHEELLGVLRTNRDYLEERINSMPGLRMIHAEATYLGWIDARGLGVTDPAAFFEEAGVGFSDGAHFGAPGFLRVNFGCPGSVVREAVERMEKALRLKNG